MHDPVGDVLRQRAALGRGASAGIAVSVMLHGGLTALAIYAALHATPPRAARMVSITLTQPALQQRAAVPSKPVPPRIEEPKPEPPKTTPPKPPEKNTVPLSPFGQSPKRGSENPETKPKTVTAPPSAATSTGVTSTTPVVPVGGSGVTALEGGDFPYTLYLEAMQRRISSNWFRPQIGGDLAVVIYFRIQRDGTITDVKPEVPSGNGTFDRQALSAVRSASPLNPLPFAYNGTYLGVHLTFR